MHASSPPHIVGASHLLAGIALFPRDAAAAELRELGIDDCAPLFIDMIDQRSGISAGAKNGSCRLNSQFSFEGSGGQFFLNGK